MLKSAVIAALLLAACGGSSTPCAVAGEHDLVATRTEATTSAAGACTDLPTTIAVHASIAVENGHASGTLTEDGVAHPVDYSTAVNGCFVELTWVDRSVSTFQPTHSYVLHLDDATMSYATIARPGTCMALYSVKF